MNLAFDDIVFFHIQCHYSIDKDMGYHPMLSKMARLAMSDFRQGLPSFCGAFGGVRFLRKKHRISHTRRRVRLL
jgi:hypothetical protein